jgi:galactokinase
MEECQRVMAGGRALRNGNIAELGRLMLASHESSRRLFETTTPKLDLLAEAAGAQPGCYGARMSGGGFGGYIAALVEADRLENVRKGIAATFEATYGHQPASFGCRLGDGARQLDPTIEGSHCG